jgi:hypothetical protein
MVLVEFAPFAPCPEWSGPGNEDLTMTNENLRFALYAVAMVAGAAVAIIAADAVASVGPLYTVADMTARHVVATAALFGGVGVFGASCIMVQRQPARPPVMRSHLTRDDAVAALLPALPRVDYFPGAYSSRDGFRPVVRMYRDGKPAGNKSAPFKLRTQAEAEAFARCAALRVAMGPVAKSHNVAVH